MKVLKAFLAGAVAVVVFHQGALALLRLIGFTSRAPFSLEATRPFGVPQVVSLAFWGGVWGVILWAALRGISRPGVFWTTALIAGTLATTLVAWFLVAPLKGAPIAGGWKPDAMATALIVNFAWALGTALLFRLMRVTPRAVQFRR